MIKALEALCYLDDIAHGRKMSLDPHELKLIIEKELKALEIIKPLVDLTKGTNYCWLWLGLNGVQISQEKYDLLKEVLDYGR